ncbi:MAG: DUF4272 domain-containing protein [Bacteroidetes bacterium]|nr:MAG: DUF4272 domain-containing protein [Bacteroidota bacterium]
MNIGGIDPEKIKTENTSYLKGIGIEVIDHLPYIEVNEFQEDENVAKRCLVLAALLQLYFGAPNDFIESWLKENNLTEYLTSEEQKVLNTSQDDLSDQDKTDLYWTIEAIWALAWVGNKHNDLTFNTGVEDSLANMLPSFRDNESSESFINGFKIRSKEEIFTKLDQFYRAHWFARNNSLNGKENSEIDIDLIMERRKALEWVCNKAEKWDEVSLDT